MFARVIAGAVCLVSYAVASHPFGVPRVSELASNERIVVSFRTTKPPLDNRREYELIGGPTVRLRIFAIGTKRGPERNTPVKHLLGELLLTSEDRTGLDTLFDVYRSNFVGGTGSEDSIQVAYFKGGSSWGPDEEFVDGLRINSRTRSEFLAELRRFRLYPEGERTWLTDIVTFQQVEDRLPVTLNQLPDPMALTPGK